MRLLGVVLLACWASVAWALPLSYWGKVQGQGVLRCDNGAAGCLAPISFGPTTTSTSSTTVKTTTTTSTSSSTIPGTTPTTLPGAIQVQGDRILTVLSLVVQAPPDTSSMFAVQDKWLQRYAWVEDTGAFFMGEFAGRYLERNIQVRLNERFNFDNGDVYVCTREGTTGLGRPASIPYSWQPDLPLPAGARVYPGWGSGSMPGSWLVAGAACRTARGTTDNPQPPTCPTDGCTVTDGTCTFTRQAVGTVAFVDGSAAFSLAAFDPYGGAKGVQLNQDRPGAPSEILTTNDNEDPTFMIGRPQIAVARSVSNLDLGDFYDVYLAGGDKRDGRPDFMFRAEPGNAQVFRIGTTTTIMPPAVAPTLTWVAGGGAGAWPVGQLQAFSATYYDERLNEHTALSTRAVYGMPSTLGLQTAQLCWPGPWLVAPGSSSPTQLSVGLFWGSREAWSTFIAIADEAHSCILVPGPSAIRENSTGPHLSANVFPLLTVTDPNIRPGKWQPNQVGLETSRALVQGGNWPYQLIGAQCTGPCSGCRFNTTGTTGSVEPVWQNFGGGLVPDGSSCWQRMPQAEAVVSVMGKTCVTRLNNGDHAPKIAACMDEQGFYGYNPNCWDPLKCPTFRLDTNGLQFLNPDGTVQKTWGRQ